MSLDEIKPKLVALLKNMPIKRAFVFGSFARGDNNENSDLDLMVEFNDGVTLFDLIRLRTELSEDIGIKIDLGTTDSLNKSIKEQVESERIMVYER